MKSSIVLLSGLMVSIPSYGMDHYCSAAYGGGGSGLHMGYGMMYTSGSPQGRACPHPQTRGTPNTVLLIDAKPLSVLNFPDRKIYFDREYQKASQFEWSYDITSNLISAIEAIAHKLFTIQKKMSEESRGAELSPDQINEKKLIIAGNILYGIAKDNKEELPVLSYSAYKIVLSIVKAIKEVKEGVKPEMKLLVEAVTVLDYESWEKLDEKVVADKRDKVILDEEFGPEAKVRLVFKELK